MTTILLIAGGTASGKTTIARALEKRTNAVLIHHDRYYKDIPHPRGYNFDEPAALESTLLAEHIRRLKSGLHADLPVYDFPTHSRKPEKERVFPKSLIIVEGILVMSDPELRKLGDLCAYVEAPDDIRLTRRIKRDVLERGRDVESVLEQYLSTVRPMHNRHILPCKEHASIIIDGVEPVLESVKILEEELQKLLNRD